MANGVDPDQTAPIGAVCSGSTLFVSILNSSVMLGKRILHADQITPNLLLFAFDSNSLHATA